MTVIVLDSTTARDEAVSFDTVATDHRNLLMTAASTIATTVLDVEGKLAASAKAWGASVFTLAYPTDGTKASTLDSLIADSKGAAGWNVLTTTDDGKKAKARLEVYFSNARLVAEGFEGLSVEDQNDIRLGMVSIHYRANLIRKAASDEKKAKAKADALAAAQAAADAAKADAAASTDEAKAPVIEAAPRTIADMLAELALAIDAASDDELTAVYQDVTDVVAAFDARIVAANPVDVAIAS